MHEYIYQFPEFKKLSANTYHSLCPVHDDNSPSLHITEKDDVVLMHCFACGANGKDVCEALGFDPMVLLFNKEFRPSNDPKKITTKIPARDILECLKHETTLITLYAQGIARGEKLEPKDFERIGKAAARIQVARI